MKWSELSYEEIRIIMEMAPHPLGVMIGIPAARREVEQSNAIQQKLKQVRPLR